MLMAFSFPRGARLGLSFTGLEEDSERTSYFRTSGVPTLSEGFSVQGMRGDAPTFHGCFPVFQLTLVPVSRRAKCPSSRARHEEGDEPPVHCRAGMETVGAALANSEGKMH